MVRREPLDPEVLAALLEGTLSARERGEVLEHLAQSPDDFEAFVEAASVLRDLDDDAGAAPVPPTPPTTSSPTREIRPARRWLPGPKLWLPLAALLAGVLVVSRVVLSGGAPTPVALLERDPLVRSGSLAATLGPDWSQPGWSVQRGGGQSLAEQRRDFRIGVRLAGLDAALDAGDARAVQQVAPQLISLLEEVGPGAGPAARFYRRLNELATQGDPRREPDLEAQAAADLVDALQDSPWFGLGVWVEQARLATLARRTEFFADPDARAVLEDLIESVGRQSGSGARVAGSLRSLESEIRNGVTPDDIEAIRTALAAIIRESGG